MNHAVQRNEKLRPTQADKLLPPAVGPPHGAPIAKKPFSHASAGFAERLRAIRLNAGYADAAAFARDIGVEPPTYRKWERGGAEPAFAHLDRIQELTRCSLDWLITGKVPRFDNAA